MDKSSHKTPFRGSGQKDAATQNPIATQEKDIQIYGLKQPQDTVLWVCQDAQTANWIQYTPLNLWWRI